MAVTPFKSSDNFNMAGFNEKITEADNTYVAKTGDSMTGALSMSNNKITDVASPTSAGDVANKGYVDGANIFTKKHIGTITAPNVQLPFTFNDLELCRGIFIDFTAESIAHDAGRYYAFGVVAVGEESKSIPLFEMFSYDAEGTLINNIKSKLFLPKQRATSSNTAGNAGFYFNDAFNIVLPLNSNEGYFKVDNNNNQANNYRVDIYWIM